MGSPGAMLLDADLFPYPGTWGLEYLGLLLGRSLLVVMLLFAAAWILDAITEGVRPWLAKRTGHVVSVLISLVLTLGEIVGVFFAYLRLLNCRYIAQGTTNLSLIECGLLLGVPALLLVAVLSVGGGRVRRGVRAALAGIALLLAAAAALFIWRCYGVKPPRNRAYWVVWRELWGMVALAAGLLAAAARVAWRRPRSWKSFVPKIAWIAFAAVLVRGALSFLPAIRVSAVSAGSVACGGSGAGDGAAPVRLEPGCDLQAAIDSAPAGSVLLVPPGVYGPVSTGGRAVSLRSVDGPGVTVIDASLAWGRGVTNRCATLVPERSDRAWSRFFYDTQFAHQLGLGFMVPAMGSPEGMAHFDGAVRGRAGADGGRSVQPALSGFTLRNGHADLGGAVMGGVVENCVIESCLAEFCGGGAWGSELVGCVVSNNVSAWMGGGAWGGVSRGTAFVRNGSQYGGGAWGGAHGGALFDANMAEVGGACAAARLDACSIGSDNTASVVEPGAFGGGGAAP